MILDSQTDVNSQSEGYLIRGLIIRIATLMLFTMALLLTGGCSNDPGTAAIESDANGYYCRHCKTKMYTERRVFLENCPKCGAEALVGVVGYRCEADQHLTIRPQVDGPEGASVCEKCGAVLKNAMVLPHEKDLLAWGATKEKTK